MPKLLLQRHSLKLYSCTNSYDLQYNKNKWKNSIYCQKNNL